MGDSLLTGLLRKLSKPIESKAVQEAEREMAETENLLSQGHVIGAPNVFEPGRTELAPEIAACYIALLKKARPGQKPGEVLLVPGDRLALDVDGARVDLRAFDRRSRQLAEEIEALFQDGWEPDVQRWINAIIQKEW